MVRKLTPKSSLENLKREAKRWLKALQANDPDARARFERAHPGASAQPTLRDVQLALAREHGVSGWNELKALVDRQGASATSPELAELLEVAGKGNVARVKSLLDANPEFLNQRGDLNGSGLRTALHFGSGHIDVVRTLLERGADPNIRDEGDDAMPLHFVAERGDMEVARLLVEHGADPVGDGTMHELNVLGWAICWDYVHNREVAEYLLAHGARHTVHTAVALGDVDALREVVSRAPTDVDKPMDRTNLRRRPIHLAVIKKQLGALEALLDLGADINVRDARGLTALDQAALNGEEAMVQLLVARGARFGLPAAIALNRTDDLERMLREEPRALARGGRWANLIVHCAGRAPGRVMELLIRAGADVNAGGDPESAVDQTHNYTALHAAAWDGNTEAITVLLKHGANVRARDSKYCGTPAGWANYNDKPEARDLILEGPIDPFDAINHDRIDRLEQILDAEPDALNRPFREYAGCEPESGHLMPLDVAIKAGKPDAERVLRERGAIRGDSVGFRATDALPPETESREDLTDRFLENACPDHHVRGVSDHEMAYHTAMRILDRHPEIARDSIYTAVVCGDVDEVRRILTQRREIVREKRTLRGQSRASSGGSGDRFIRELGSKDWEPLLFLCFTRLPLPAANDNALVIARMLLDHGADPNAFFMAGDSRYTPLVGAIGEGEEGRPPHPRRDELVRLLLERGAEPYDGQVIYNIHFKGDVLWFLQLIHKRAAALGRQGDWDDPEWTMLSQGDYGTGARWHLEIAVKGNDIALAEWCLAHGANPNSRPARDKRFPRMSLHEMALRRGSFDVAELLVRYGAKPAKDLGETSEFERAAFALDRGRAQSLARKNPLLLKSTDAMFNAVRRDRADVVELLLDLGMSPDVKSSEHERPLHIAGYHNAVRSARLLIARGAEIDPREGNYSNTPIDCAYYYQHRQMIDLLVTQSRDVWNLVYAGAVERLREVLASDPALAKVSWDGWTPLMWLPDDEDAALAIVELFLTYGADVTVRNSHGLTAEDYARKRALDAVADRLRAATKSGG